MGNFLPSLTQTIPFWPPDEYLGLIRKSPSRVQRPISAVKIPHSPLSPLSSAKQPVSEDVPEIKGHTAALGALTQSYSQHRHHEYGKISNESFNLPTAFSLKRKGLPFSQFPPLNLLCGNAPEKSRDFTLTRQRLYAKESNAPQTLCAELRRAGRPAGRPGATRARAATHGDTACGGQGVPAPLQTPAPGPNGVSVITPWGLMAPQNWGVWGGSVPARTQGQKRTNARRPGGPCFHTPPKRERKNNSPRRWVLSKPRFGEKLRPGCSLEPGPGLGNRFQPPVHAYLWARPWGHSQGRLRRCKFLCKGVSVADPPFPGGRAVPQSSPALTVTALHVIQGTGVLSAETQPSRSSSIKEKKLDKYDVPSFMPCKWLTYMSEMNAERRG